MSVGKLLNFLSKTSLCHRVNIESREAKEFRQNPVVFYLKICDYEANSTDLRQLKSTYFILLVEDSPESGWRGRMESQLEETEVESSVTVWGMWS